MDTAKWVQLSEIAALITKGTTPTTIGFDFQDTGINFLKIECFSEDGAFIEDKVAHISEECHEKLKRSQLEAGDILFSIAGAIGRVAVVMKEMLPANTNQALAIIRINRKDIYLPYIKLILTSPIVRTQFERKKQGVAQLNISLKDINELEIPLPTINKQIEYATLFEKVSRIIVVRKQQLQKLDELVKSRFVEMFGDPLADDMRYPKVQLGSLTDVGSSKRIFEKEYVNEGIPFYRTKEIVELSRGNRITTELFITKERYDEIKKEYGVPQAGDLLISAVGTIGVIWIVDGRNDFYFKDGNLLRIDSSDRFAPIYLKYLLEALIGTYKLKMSSGTAYAALTISALKEMLVYKVPLELQNRFAAFVAEVDKSKLAVQQSLEKLETLKKSLMQQYFG